MSIESISEDEQNRKVQLEVLKEKYLDLLIQIPLSYQTHEMVEIRSQIAELKEQRKDES